MTTVFRPDADDASQERRIRRLVGLAYNLRWTWEPRASRIFSALAPDVWQATHNPVAVLREVAAGDARVLTQNTGLIDEAAADLERYLDSDGVSPSSRFPRIAYLCAEFAVANCLPFYSGGLGVLAGDQLKAASDLGLPLIGIGLLYRFGYFRQRLDPSGRQIEDYQPVDPGLLPLRPVLVGERAPCHVRIPFPQRQVHARAWSANIGRTRLYLLDTDLPENRDDDRWITGHLYGGDQDTRLRQEMVLGVGGIRLLRALQAAGVEGDIQGYHLNEGHCAIAVLELARERLEAGVAGSVEEAMRQVAPTVIFSTHTTEPAGHDVFSSDLMEAYLSTYRRQLGLSHAELMRLGRVHVEDEGEPFNMTVLAMRGASRRNAVSPGHARISRAIGHDIGLGARNRQPVVAMDAITNGVHAPSWVGPEMATLFDSWLGRIWRVQARTPASWAPLDNVPRTALWHARTAQRGRLMARARIDGDPGRMLLIGFARRFAAYKRVGLLLERPDRLANILTGDVQRPVTIIMAGKAHPRDEAGKRLVQDVVEASHNDQFAGRIVFLPDYDLEIARLLVQGADVWLNTPRRPHEACGTSGMKAALNGALHLSELDGWWEDAYRPDLGWSLGADLPDALSEAERDAAEASELMDILEQQVVPAFYARDTTSVPAQWLDEVVRSIVNFAPHCSAERMLVDYATRMYNPLAAEVLQTAREL